MAPRLSVNVFTLFRISNSAQLVSLWPSHKQPLVNQQQTYDRGHCCSGTSQKTNKRRTRTRTKRTTQHEQENQEPTTAMSEAPRGGTIPGQETTTRKAQKSGALKCPTCTSEDTCFLDRRTRGVHTCLLRLLDTATKVLSHISSIRQLSLRPLVCFNRLFKPIAFQNLPTDGASDTHLWFSSKAHQAVPRISARSISHIGF